MCRLLWILLGLLLLAGMGLALGSCGPLAAPPDNGPNAHLSNAALLEQALTNSAALYDPAQTPAAGPIVLVETPGIGAPITPAYTWRWSRLNEDFGVVAAPPTEMSK